MKYIKFILLVSLLFFTIQLVNNDVSYGNTTTEDEYTRKYKEALKELKSVLNSMQGKNKEKEQQSQEQGWKSIVEEKEKEKIEKEIEKKQETIAETEKEKKVVIDANTPYTKKYNIDIVKDFFEKDVQNLLVSQEAKVVFFSNNIVEVYDVHQGHKKIEEYIDDLERKLVTYQFVLEVEIKKDKKVFEGIVSTVLPARFNNGMGTIEIVPRLKDKLFVGVYDMQLGINTRLILPVEGGQQSVKEDTMSIKLTLRRI